MKSLVDLRAGDPLEVLAAKPADHVEDGTDLDPLLRIGRWLELNWWCVEGRWCHWLGGYLTGEPRLTHVAANHRGVKKTGKRLWVFTHAGCLGLTMDPTVDWCKSKRSPMVW